MPLTLKPVPLALTAEIVTDEPPELVTVSESVFELPVVTLPNESDVGLPTTSPAVTPVPESDALNVGVVASEETVNVPEELPEADG